MPNKQQDEQEFLDWWNGLPDYAKKTAESGLSHEQQALIDRQDSPTTPTDVAQASLDPSNEAWNDAGDVQQAQHATGLVNSDPLDALVAEASLQNDWERDQYEEHQGKLDWIAGTGAGMLGEAGARADDANAWIVGNLANQWYGDMGREVDYGPYAGDAASDPNAAAWQYGAMAEYADRAQGGLTPVERAEMEMTRRMQERDLQSQNQAYMRDMQMRGASSSGLEVANMLGAQQATGERRMLQDMGQQALAQQRADRALDAGAALAGDIRSSSFGESSFNKQLKSQYDNQRANFVQEEQRRRMQGTQDVAGAAAGAVSDAYAHQTAPVTFGANVLTGFAPNQPTGSGLGNALGASAGDATARDAARLLQEDDDEGILGIPGIPIL